MCRSDRESRRESRQGRSTVRRCFWTNDPAALKPADVKPCHSVIASLGTPPHPEGAEGASRRMDKRAARRRPSRRRFAPPQDEDDFLLLLSSLLLGPLPKPRHEGRFNASGMDEKCDPSP
jgi:hypothetical protein